MRRAIACGLVMLATAVMSGQQPKVAVHDLAAMPMLDQSGSLRLKKVMGQNGTFALGEFAAGLKPGAPPHHHTHEQINVGLTETIELKAGGVDQRLTRLQGLLIPSDVAHGSISTTAAAQFIEFQPVKRLDLVPERAKTVFPAAPTELPVPKDWNLNFDFSSSDGWERLPNGARVASRRGRAVAVSAWQIPESATAPFDLRLHAPGAEQYVYVVSGAVEARSGDERHSVMTGSLVVNPPNSRPLQVRAVKGSSLLLVFEAVKLDQ